MSEVQVYDGGLKFGHTVGNGATISECGEYRYLLTRHIPQIVRHVKPCLFVLLNPSTADASIPDPTMTRCMGFATDWLCTSLTIVNAFALRSKDPKVLYTHVDPRGPENQRHVDEQLALHKNTGVIICGWGTEKAVYRQSWSHEFFEKLKMAGAKCLGVNKNGSPKHPLYIKKTAERILWTGAGS